jgi:hypothetical protein
MCLCQWWGTIRSPNYKGPPTIFGIHVITCQKSVEIKGILDVVEVLSDISNFAETRRPPLASAEIFKPNITIKQP